MKKKFRPKVIVMIDRAKLNIIQRIRFEYNLLQNKVAGYLSDKEQALSTARKKMYFFLFIGSFGSYFIYVIISGFNLKSAPGLNFGNIHASKIHDSPGSGQLNIREIRVLNYITYLDSLKASHTGRVKYDSILKHNPGLMDTLTFIKSHVLPTNQ